MRTANKLACLLFAVLSAPAALAADTATLGRTGEVYTIRTGGCADLFPGLAACPPGNEALALDVQRPGQLPERLLVPSTEDQWPENSASLLFEDGSASLFVVWESWWNGIHPQLNLASLGPDGWSEVVKISGQPFTEKSSPRLAVTRDSYSEPDGDGGRVARARTVVHVAWRENLEPAVDVVRYAPLVLVDGQFIGANEVFTLDDFLATPALTESGTPGALRHVLEIQPGRDAGTVVVGFGDSADRLHTVALLVVPGEMSQLSEHARYWLIERFSTAAGPLNIDALAAGLRAELIRFGQGLNPALVDYLAAQVERLILDLDLSGELDQAADKARHHIVDVGLRLVTGQLLDSGDFARHHIVDVGYHLETGRVEHQESFRPVGEWPAPAIGQGPSWLFVSGSGSNALVAWAENETTMQYRETLGGAWSETRTLSLGPQLTQESAFQILERRIQGR